MQAFETKRLFLRPWQESDLQDFHEYCRDPEVGPNAGWKPHENMEESQKVLTEFIGSSKEYALVLKENNKAVGSLGFETDRIPHKGMGKGREIGYVLSHDYWGHGLMPEAVRGAIRFAFETMDLDYLSVAHFPFNERSKRVIEKCGFQYEKTLNGSCINYKGEKLDEKCYLMTRKDYFRFVRK